MKKTLTLIVLLIAVFAVIFGVHYLGSKVDNSKKYTHPISRPGAHW